MQSGFQILISKASGLQIRWDGEYGDEPVFIIPSFEEKWWHIFYRIPRRY